MLSTSERVSQEAAFCHECGTAASSRAAFCHRCGTKLTTFTAVAPTVETNSASQDQESRTLLAENPGSHESIVLAADYVARETIPEELPKTATVPPTASVPLLPMQASLGYEAFVLEQSRIGSHVIRRAGAGEEFRVTALDDGFACVDIGRRRGYIRADALGFDFTAPEPEVNRTSPLRTTYAPRAASLHDSGTPASGTFFLFVLLTVAGAIIAMTALISMPLASCGPLSMKASDFSDEYKVAAFDLCGKFGGSQKPDSGLWIVLLGGAMASGGGGAVILSRRNSEAARSG